MKLRRAITFATPKGGVGKTYAAKLHYDLLPLHGRTVAAWDLDAATGTFAVYDGGIKTFDMQSKSLGASWLDDCYSDIDDVLVDVPGGRIDELLRTFGDGDARSFVKAIADAGRDLVVFIPIGVMMAETVTSQIVLNAFASTEARIVIAKNGRFGDADDFVIYDGVDRDGERRYGATRDLATQVGAETVFMPALAPRLLAQVEAEGLRLVAAAGAVGIARLGRLAATRVSIYFASVAEAWRGTSLDLDGAVPQRGISG